MNDNTNIIKVSAYHMGGFDFHLYEKEIERYPLLDKKFKIPEKFDFGKDARITLKIEKGDEKWSIMEVISVRQNYISYTSIITPILLCFVFFLGFFSQDSYTIGLIVILFFILYSTTMFFIYDESVYEHIQTMDKFMSNNTRQNWWYIFKSRGGKFIPIALIPLFLIINTDNLFIKVGDEIDNDYFRLRYPFANVQVLQPKEIISIECDGNDINHNRGILTFTTQIEYLNTEGAKRLLAGEIDIRKLLYNKFSDSTQVYLKTQDVDLKSNIIHTNVFKRKFSLSTSMDSYIYAKDGILISLINVSIKAA